MASLRVTAHTVIPTTIGTIITPIGHNGRLRSCSMVNNTTIAKGNTVRKSNTAHTK